MRVHPITAKILVTIQGVLAVATAGLLIYAVTSLQSQISTNRTNLHTAHLLVTEEQAGNRAALIAQQAEIRSLETKREHSRYVSCVVLREVTLFVSGDSKLALGFLAGSPLANCHTYAKG